MAEQDTDSVPALIRGVLNDARELIREEIALAKAELREEASAIQGVGVAFGAAALFGVLAVVLLCIALGEAVADLFNASPWVGHAIVAVLLAGAAYLCVSRGRTRLGNIRALPKTKESLRENMAWIRSKSSSK